MGNQIRLYGVDGVRGRPVREMQRYLGRREVVCEPIGTENYYQHAEHYFRSMSSDPETT